MKKNDTAKDKNSPLVLIADDNEEMRLYLRHILQREGYKALEAVNGAEAVDLCRGQQIDIVLLDAVMPEMDGFAASRAIRQIPGYGRTPVLMVTALDDSKSLDLAFEAGASEYITKPVHWNFLMQRIGHLLESYRAEERIRQSEERLAEAQAIAHLGNWDWNIVTNALFWSDEIYRIFGLAPQEFGATYDTFLERVHPDDREYVKETVNRTLATKEKYSIDHRVVRPDGTERIVHELGKVFYNDNGKPVRMIGIVHDITERKLVEKKLQEYSESLEELVRQRTAEIEQQKTRVEDASRAKSEFLATMSHELKTPLNGVLGFSDILLNGSADPLSDEQREFLGEIVGNGRHLLAMIEEMLAVAQLENETAAIDHEPFDLETLLRDCLHASQKKYGKSGVEALLTVDPAIGTIRADRSRIWQVMVNLLDNGFKFSPEDSSVHLSAALSRNGNTKCLKIAVTDSGPGISDADQEKLFLPFQQLDGSYTRKFGGIGMGLFKVKKIVDLFGGRIEVTSPAGKGSRFTVFFPMGEAIIHKGTES